MLLFFATFVPAKQPKSRKGDTEPPTVNHGGGRRHRHHTRNDDGLCFGLSV